mmetsp:Transcript_21059/g.36217  ORF Transcript_21059/g.36217 Transcript_21059/m.36217 type:complete len:249 (+) Transcript_21059:2167-2913(+)
MLQKHRMDRLANLHHTTESKRQVGDTSTDLHVWALLLDCLCCVDEVNTIVCMLLHSRSNCQHVGVKDDVLRRETNFIHQDVIRALADSDFLIFRGCLAFLVEGHHNHCTTMLPQQGGLLLEELLPNLQGDGVHNALSLAPLQTSKHNLKLRRIKHEGDLGHLWLCHRNLHKLLHRSKTIQHAIIHIDINHMRSILNLLLRNVHGRTIVTSHHQLLEPDRTTDIAPLTNIQKREAKVIMNIIHNQIFQT